MVFDGKPLAAHELSAEKEPTKRLNEMRGFAYALVGAKSDGMVRELRSLCPALPDFEAELVDGRIVRIETCALANEDELQYCNALKANERRVNAKLAEHSVSKACAIEFNKIVGPQGLCPYKGGTPIKSRVCPRNAREQG